MSLNAPALPNISSLSYERPAARFCFAPSDLWRLIFGGLLCTLLFATAPVQAVAANDSVVLAQAIDASSPTSEISDSSRRSTRHRHDHNHDGHDHDHGHAHGTDGLHDHDGENGSLTWLWGCLAAYSVLIAAASLFGGWLPGRFQFTHLQFQMLLSLIGGLLLGIAIFHLLTHAIHELGTSEIDAIAGWLMAGILMMFFLLRAFHVHHHEPAPTTLAAGESAPTQQGSHDTGHVHMHDHDCGHDHDHDDSHTSADSASSQETQGLCHHAHADHAHSRLGWAGMFFGLGVHTLLDGIALGASMKADFLHGLTGLLGIGVLAGIVLHKPLDSLSITALMLDARCARRQRILVNLIYATLCPLGAALFLLGVSTVGGAAATVVAYSLAFSAGIFICVALSDLLPEMEFHSHHRWRLTICLLAGIAIAWGLRFLEPEHLHH